MSEQKKEKLTPLGQIVTDWKTLQVYHDEEGPGYPFEARLPRYDKTDDLMFGEGETVAEAIDNLVENIRHFEDDKTRYEKTVGGLEVTPDIKEIKAAAAESGIHHLFRNGESLCGSVEIEEDMETLDPKEVEEDEICQLCLRSASAPVRDVISESSSE